ncbi:MAG: hypothetical protein ACRENQ_10890 [Gemmatimonadaceae bacterium]
MRFVIGVSGILLATTGAPRLQAQQAVKLRFLPRVHQVERYRFSAQVMAHLPGLAQADTTQPLLTETMYTTRAVTGGNGGVWTIRTQVDSANIAVAGRLAPSGDLLRGMTIREMMDSLGRAYAQTVTPPPGALVGPFHGDAHANERRHFPGAHELPA